MQSALFHLFSESFLYKIHNFFHFRDFSLHNGCYFRKAELSENVQIDYVRGRQRQLVIELSYLLTILPITFVFAGVQAKEDFYPLLFLIVRQGGSLLVLSSLSCLV